MISIHALLTESDIQDNMLPNHVKDFNPRSPHGERRVCNRYAIAKFFISIHALLTESDWSGIISRWGRRDFNPRSPHGERQAGSVGGPHVSPKFQSTLSSRRATLLQVEGIAKGLISIHALLTESDCLAFTFPIPGESFQSTLSSRRATRDAGIGELDFVISIHALLTESDFISSSVSWIQRYFNPRSPHGERRRTERRQPLTRRYFNPRSPHGERQ